jgi:putative ABC transport system permease protein
VNATALMVMGLKGREQELAVRSAIGAGRRALVAEMVMESVVLSGVAAAVGGGLASLGVTALKNIIPRSVPRWETITLGWEPLVISGVLGFLALLVAGVIPAWKVARGTPWEGLSASSGRGRTRSTGGQSILVGVQVAMAVALLFGALQLGRSARELATTDLRFDHNNVLAFQAPLDFRALPTPEGDAELYLRFRDRLSEIPGVEVVGAVSNLPLSGTGPVDAFTPDMADTLAAWDNALASYLPVLPGYFESVSIPLQLGRFFTDAETREGDQVVIVDETLARMAFPGEDPIGRTLRLGWGIPDSRIIGVVAHARIMDPRREVRPQIYVPYGLFRWNPLHFTVRAGSDPLALIPAVREAARDVGTGRALSGFQLLSENVATASSTLRAVSILLVVLAVSAALLSALGLYAVVSSVVIQKRKATAIRGALGASPRHLLRQELRSGTMVLIPALPAGILLSLMGGRLLESLVFGVPVRDPLSLMVAAGLGVLVALGGTFLPALRASRTDPASALQAD